MASSAYVVAEGDRFVVRASEEEVVLRRTVNGRQFPVATANLVGKAVLIHPVPQAAEDGVYARVLEAGEAAGIMNLKTRPLTLQEMSEATEAEIVRIYLDPKLQGDTVEAPRGGGGSAEPLFGLPGLKPKSVWHGVLTGDFPIMGEIQLADGIRWENNMTVAYHHDGMRLTPRMKLDWSRAEGLELGFRTDFSYDGRLEIKGDTNVRGRIFRTRTARTPRIARWVMIGPVPVHVSVGLATFLECESMGKTQFDGTIKVHLGAYAGASVRLRQNSFAALPDVGPGEWPNGVSGLVSTSVEGSPHFGAGSGIECTLPRVELETLVAGVAGPYLALCPEFRRTRDPGGLPVNSNNVTIKLGMRGRLFGREANTELDLISWAPE